ncbi:DNA -binding domain-containing protein [Sphingomonas gei]|uniref:DNA -binding domain-containing protein n=1 Tax=Sphingomonas gei TaxID=1395960 RepID=UPI003B82C628
MEQGSLAAGEPVLLHYRLKGIATAEPRILPLRRLIDLCRNRRFSKSLYPPDPRVERWILALRVHDAVMDGASQREIARVLFDDAPVRGEGDRRSDSIRSRVRRLVGEARRLAGGGYRALMRRGD